MHTDAHTRKSGGRLSREDQRRLGDILQRVYDDVIRQGVPDRFKELLNELDESKATGEAGQGGARGSADGTRDPEPDRLVEAKGLRQDKGTGSLARRAIELMPWRSNSFLCIVLTLATSER